MGPSQTNHRICLIGAGFISQVHAEAIAGLPGLDIAGIVDTRPNAAQKMADTWQIPNVFSSVDEAIRSGQVTAFHVLVPPDAHHDVAAQCLAAGLPAFVEKPLATSAAQCRNLLELSHKTRAPLGVNQNFVFHPAFSKLHELVERKTFGPLDAIECIYSMPLRQLIAKQFGHWMFHDPKNILLEQAVHPLSQLCTLTGAVETFTAFAGAPRPLSPGVPFHDYASVSFKGTKAPAHLHFAVGRDFPCWQVTAICKDGVIVADIIRNRIHHDQRSKWLEAAEHMMSGLGMAKDLAGQSLVNGAEYALSIAGLKGRSDAFFKSMQRSIEAFYKALESQAEPTCDGAFGASLVQFCEDIATQAFTLPARSPSQERRPQNDYDILVIGGTGFIGRHVIERLTQEGRRVGVMARNTRNLPESLLRDDVILIKGDATKAADLDPAIAPAKVVINLAHGGGGESWPEIQRNLVGSARLVAEHCLAHKVEKLIHVGSIAGLYLGDAGAVIDATTPPDPQADQRADYARAKAEADRILMDWHERKGLPVCILRPGIVIGEGTSPFHSGVGVYNNDQHCLGWNAGTNPLPFVLVEDVAQAIVNAIDRNTVIGKTYNLTGDVCLTASEYVAELARATQRPLRYHPQNVLKLQAVELGKWLIKRLSGRRVALPSYRDLKSRGMAAHFDNREAKRDLDWTPVADRREFIRRAIEIHA